MAKVPRPRNTLESGETSEGSNSILDLCSPFLNGRNTFWCCSVRLLLAHADLQQELEVEFEGEEGTGLGPTMEFYALLSAELRYEPPSSVNDAPLDILKLLNVH